MADHTLGIIGYGDMGRWHAENILSRVAGLTVKGVYDIKPEKGKAAQKAGLKAYASAEALLADEQIDIVLVATPNNFHAAYSMRAMRAGKHVVCEKPVCMNTAEFEQVAAVAAETGCIFTVHQNRRWDIDYAIMRASLPQIGKPYFIDSRLFGSKGLPGDWRSCPEAGGGMLYDWASHLIDQMLCLVNARPVRVYCELVRVKFPDVDDCNRINIVFDNGVHTQIVVDSWCYIGEPRWHASGDDGTLLINDWFGTDGKIMKANIKEINWEKGVIFTKSGRTRTMAPRPKEDLQELPLVVPEEPRWEEFYENVMAAAEGKAKLIVTIEQERQLMRILDACFVSGKTGQTVDL